MTNHQDDKAEPFFLTADQAAELAASGYDFKTLCYARTKSVRDLFGWEPGETLEEAIA